MHHGDAHSFIVVAALVAAIHDHSVELRAWVAGTSPAMTDGVI